MLSYEASDLLNWDGYRPGLFPGLLSALGRGRGLPQPSLYLVTNRSSDLGSVLRKAQ